MYASSRVGHCVKNYCLHVSWKQIPKENQCIELWRTIFRKKAFHLQTSSHGWSPPWISKLFEKSCSESPHSSLCDPSTNLVAKNLSEKLHESLSTVITAVNKIKVNALNSRLFHQLCIENDKDFQCLLLHTEVWWLSKGFKKVLHTV